MNDLIHPTPAESAHSRLQEFPDDPIGAAHEIAKTKRMDEMEAWANGIGAHVERLQHAHRTVAGQIIDHAKRTGTVSAGAEDRLRNVPRDWRTGVRVHENGDIEVHDHYPYSGDTPAGNWKTYRHPKKYNKPVN